MPVTLYLAIPCYNEEEVLPETAKRLREKFSALRKTGTISAESRACFIDDGSKDKTWNLICELHQKDPMFSGIKLSRNRGHQKCTPLWPNDFAGAGGLCDFFGCGSPG